MRVTGMIREQKGVNEDCCEVPDDDKGTIERTNVGDAMREMK